MALMSEQNVTKSMKVSFERRAKYFAHGKKKLIKMKMHKGNHNHGIRSASPNFRMILVKMSVWNFL